MEPFHNHDSIKQLDSYSLLIVSKYFESTNDFVNVICVCKKFKETTEKLRFNPIPVTSLKLFPKMQTQYLYNKNNRRIKGINLWEIWYKVDYYTFLVNKKMNIKCHNVMYSDRNSHQYGTEIPNCVNSLSRSCFYGINITSISIPNNVTSIGSYCFNNQTSLTNISLSSNIVSIGSSTFSNCKSLQLITIPSSIQLIGYYCFQNCTSLQSIELPSSLILLNNNIFCSCYSLTNIKLSESLISIGDECFLDCKKITTINLPSSLIRIGNKCFSSCSIESITIPKSVKSIGVDCFLKCSKLTKLEFESTSKNFSFQVSYNDSILYKRYGYNCLNVLLTRNDVDHLITIEQQYDNLNNIHIPSNIVEIDNNAFSYQRNIKSIEIPTTVTSIGYDCFFNCTSLTSLIIPKSVKFIGKFCFQRREQLKKLTLPLNRNNKYPFKVSYDEHLILKQHGIYCEKIVFDYIHYYKCKKTIPNYIPLIIVCSSQTNSKSIQQNIISIKSNYLSNNITSVTIPTNVTYLCDGCFKNYSKLQSITIPTTVKYIGKHIIDTCTKLTEFSYEGDRNDIIVSYDDHLKFKSKGLIFNNIEYTSDDKTKYGKVIPSIVHSLNKTYYDRSNEIFHIPTHITSLDNKMFSSFINNSDTNYSYLKCIVIPKSIQTIPKYCFSKCYLLTSVELPSTLTLIKKKAFNDCISLQLIVIPTSVNSIEQYAFGGCYSLTSITLPTPSPKLGNKCFKGCNQLTDILNIPK